MFVRACSVERSGAVGMTLTSGQACGSSSSVQGSVNVTECARCKRRVDESAVSSATLISHHSALRLASGCMRRETLLAVSDAALISHCCALRLTLSPHAQGLRCHTRLSQPRPLPRPLAAQDLPVGSHDDVHVPVAGRSRHGLHQLCAEGQRHCMPT